MFDNYDIQEQDTLDNITEYSDGERFSEICPDCDSEITKYNPWIDDLYNPEANGHCVECYDPTPA